MATAETFRGRVIAAGAARYVSFETDVHLVVHDSSSGAVGILNAGIEHLQLRRGRT